MILLVWAGRRWAGSDTDWSSSRKLATAIGSLEAVDASILGLVLNRLPDSELGHYGYHHYYEQLQQDDNLQEDDTITRDGMRAMPIAPADVFANQA